MNRLTNDVLKNIRKEGMLSPGDTVIVGFSGGADSVCLLHMLASVRALLKIELYAFHVNHQLRGEEALRDERFCRSFCEERKLEFEAVSLDVSGYQEKNHLSLEEAARVLRYRALEEKREKLKSSSGKVWIATAHHADDQAETILMNMLRGSGLKGLGGMRPVRDGIIRPLLNVSKKEIIGYIESNGLSYVTDSSNLCNDYTRNRIRNELLPRFNTEVNNQASKHIIAAGELCRAADDYFTKEAICYLKQETMRSEDGKSLVLNQKVLKEKDKIIRRYVIIEGLRSLNVSLKDWSERHIEDIDALLFMNKGAHADLPCGVTAHNEYKETILYKKY